jgi:hypothetical protein
MNDSKQTEEGPDLEAKDFTLADLRRAQKQGRDQGIKDALTLIEAGGTPNYVREHLLTDTDPAERQGVDR